MGKRGRTPKAKPRLLLVGDAVATTGFARVLHSIFTHLIKKYEIHHLGVNYRGDPHDFEYKIYPAMIGGDLYGLKRLKPMIENVKPDLIFILSDIWVHAIYMEKLQEIFVETKKEIPVVLYFPVDGGPIEPKWVKHCEKAKRLLVYTEFAKKVIEDSISNLKLKEPNFVAPKLDIVPHGVDKDRFHPYVDEVDGGITVPGKLIAKKTLYPEKADFLDSFIVLNANRNQPRKRIDTTIKGFTLFAKDKPANVKLYLHMGVEDVGWNIVDLSSRYGIDSRLIISSMVSGIPGISDQRLNLLYNACDVGINTSVGEGWGLTNWEHAATRAAQIVPNHSSCTELWSGRGVLMNPSLFLTNERVMTEGGIVTPQTVADALELMYTNKELRDDLANKAYDFVTQEKFEWKTIATTMDKIITEVLAE